MADQIETASVVKPVGARSSVTGNSFMVVRKTSAAPAQMPGRRSGSVTRQKVQRLLWPRLRAGLLETGADLEQPGAQGAKALGQEAHGVAEDEHGDGLVEQRRVVGAEKDEGQGDDDAGQGIAKVGGAADPGAVGAGKAHLEVGNRQRKDDADGGGKGRDVDAVGGKAPDRLERLAGFNAAQKPVDDHADGHAEAGDQHGRAEEQGRDAPAAEGDELLAAGGAGAGAVIAVAALDEAGDDQEQEREGDEHEREQGGLAAVEAALILDVDHAGEAVKAQESRRRQSR